jgi:hypothetical protein
VAVTSKVQESAVSTVSSVRCLAGAESSNFLARFAQNNAGAAALAFFDISFCVAQATSEPSVNGLPKTILKLKLKQT